MRLLLDTQCWLWMQVAPERFSRSVLSRLRDPDQELLLSAASSWEIAIKFALGKLPLPEPPEAYVLSRMEVSGTTGLPVHHAHALHVSSLPMHHRDPFDRMIIAQARVEKLPILTADDTFDLYDVERLRP
jgi:PIN domain nuclease of toxin-antitoxin system